MTSILMGLDWLKLKLASDPEARLRALVIGCLVVGFIFGFLSGGMFNFSDMVKERMAEVYKYIDEKCPEEKFYVVRENEVKINFPLEPAGKKQ